MCVWRQKPGGARGGGGRLTRRLFNLKLHCCARPASVMVDRASGPAPGPGRPSDVAVTVLPASVSGMLSSNSKATTEY